MSDSTESSAGDTQTLYLTTLWCGSCEESVIFAHEGEPTSLDEDAPWPDVDVCPKCMEPYPEDLGVVVGDVHEAERVPFVELREVEA